MPGATGRLVLPYPVAGDSADVPRDVKALADRVEALTGWVRTLDLQAGSVQEDKLETPLQLKVREPELLSALPVAPVNGQTIAYQPASLYGIGAAWVLKYDPSQPTYRWTFLGGSPLSSANSGAAANLPNAWTQDPAVSVTLPLSGLYRVAFGIACLSVPAGGNVYAACSAMGAAPAAPADATTDKCGCGPSAAIPWDSVSYEQQGVYVGAGTVVRLYERSNLSGATPAAGSRWLRVTPIAVG